MRLAGEENLHRSIRGGDDAAQALEVAEEEVGPLVRGEAAGEAERERVRVEEGLDAPEVVGRAAMARELAAHTLADVGDEPRLLRAVRLPDLIVGDREDVVGEARIEEPLVEIRADVAPQQLAHLRA